LALQIIEGFASRAAIELERAFDSLMRADFKIEIDLTILNVVRVRNLTIDHEKSYRFVVDVAKLVVICDRSINARQNRESSSPKTAAARVSGHHQSIGR